MNSLYVMFKKEVLEIYRSKKFLILLVIFVFIAIGSPIIAKLIPTLLKSMPETPGISITIPDPTWKDSVDQLVKNIVQFGYIVIIFMFAGAIAEEKNKKTLELTLTKPIPRANFVLSKFFAAGAYLKIVFIASMAAFYSYTLSLFGSFSLINLAWLTLFLLIFLTLILALTIFASTISSTQIGAAGISFIISIVFTTVIGYIKKITDYSPSFILSHYQDLMTDANIADFVPSTVTSLCLIVLLIASSTYFFRKQEIER